MAVSGTYLTLGLHGPSTPGNGVVSSWSQLLTVLSDDDDDDDDGDNSVRGTAGGMPH
jgi:hypothetical protein